MKFKPANILSLLLAGTMLFGLSACSPKQEQAEAPSETVTVLDANNQEITVRTNPKRVAILEPSALDILDAAGIGSHRKKFRHQSAADPLVLKERIDV